MVMAVHHLMMITGPSLSPELSQMMARRLTLDLLVLCLVVLLPLPVVVDLVREVDRTFAVVGEC